MVREWKLKMPGVVAKQVADTYGSVEGTSQLGDMVIGHTHKSQQ
jgi:hypothetical protein